ncbi:RIBOSOMAL-L9 domain-containing protein [Aphelenchoides bicaudatus]|nr:RIBOSOMAL-L9 domain-containing protein [Aphelenchoides bicaudatus]
MSLLLRSQTARVFRICQSRNTWVFRHVVPPPVAKPGESQRKPDAYLDLMKLEVIREPKDQEQHTVKVILLEDVEGVGHQFDVMEFDHNFARDNLLLPKKATYASPFDLKYYAEMKEKMKDELAKRVRIPYEYIKLQRQLKQKVIPIQVSMDNPWKIDASILHASLFSNGVIVPLESIVLSDKYAYSGPNFELESAPVEFEVIVNKEHKISINGKIAHI